jgi:hypothetical protein
MPCCPETRRASSRSTRAPRRGMAARGKDRVTARIRSPSAAGRATDSIGSVVSQSTMSPVNRPVSLRFWASDMAPLVTSPSWYCSGSLRRTWAAVRTDCSGANSNAEICTPPRSRTAASAQKSRRCSLRIAVGTSSCAIRSVNQSSRSCAGTAAADSLDHTSGPPFPAASRPAPAPDANPAGAGSRTPRRMSRRCAAWGRAATA